MRRKSPSTVLRIRPRPSGIIAGRTRSKNRGSVGAPPADHGRTRRSAPATPDRGPFGILSGVGVEVEAILVVSVQRCTVAPATFDRRKHRVSRAFNQRDDLGGHGIPAPPAKRLRQRRQRQRISSARHRHRSSCAARAPASFGSSMSRSPRSAGYRSATPAERLTKAGTPRQIAPCTDNPYASYRAGCTSASSAANTSGMLARNPTNRTRAATPAESARSRHRASSEPAPATTKSASQSARRHKSVQAAKTTSNAFRRSPSAPTNPTSGRCGSQPSARLAAARASLFTIEKRASSLP